MKLRIVRYEESHREAVKAFNGRLLAGGASDEHLFSEVAEPVWLPRREHAELYNELYLALDGEDVRGAYALKHQPFKLGTQLMRIGYLHHPVSEAIVERRYAAVGPYLVQDAARRCPQLFAWGMGGAHQPLPRLLRALKWSVHPVGLLFRVCRPYSTLRQLAPLRRTRVRALLADVAAMSGLGALIRIAQYRTEGRRALRSTSLEVSGTFPEETDALWEAASPGYGFAAVRTRGILATLYPMDRSPIEKLVVRRGGAVVGWATVSVQEERSHPSYGDLRVGVILDSFSDPAVASTICAHATRHLQERSDLIVCVHSHAAWREALSKLGYFTGPATTVFAAAPALARLLGQDAAMHSLHLTRADGDGLAQYV